MNLKLEHLLSKPLFLVIKSFPNKWVLIILPFIYKWLARNRRSSSVTFSIESGLCKAFCNETSEEFYFTEAMRCPRYIYKEGILWRIERILNKYKSDNVYIDDGDVVFDVGANVGEFAVGASKMADKVWCFEPDTVCLPALRKNAKRSDRIVIYPLAVCGHSGKIDFFQSTSTADSSTIQPPQFASVVAVDAVSLDDFCERNKIAAINFLKIEAEGAEPEVLEGAVNLLSSGRIEKIAIDAGPERYGLPTGSSVKRILSKYGYEVSEQDFIVFGRKQ